MTFDNILDHALEMLQRRGRVTYRTLKRQFQLDDEALADLKDELLYAQPQVVDDAGKGLLWTGEAHTTPEPASPPRPAQTSAHAPSQPTPPALAEPPPLEPPTPDAERRQLTVMFCDLVGSTQLSGQLDPEDFREVVRAYQESAAAVIAQYEGHIAQYLGDGLLVYFGWPRAHEDDAQRAVRTGLGLLDAIGTLHTRLAQDQDIHLAIRVGIHTGLVVVGEMGGGGRHEYLALGETPNLAARLEGLATPNQVVISAQTRRLVGRAFDLEDLGAHAMKGVAAPMHVYGIRGEHAVESRFDAAKVHGLPPLVGREEELRLVLRRWEQAKEGEGQVVLLCGEPGIGKSRLTQAVRDCVREEAHTRLRYQCSPYFTYSAFYPIITQLERAAQVTRDDTSAQKLDKLEGLLAQATAQVTEVAPLLAGLLAIPSEDRYPPLALTPQRQKAQTIKALADQLVGLARRQPVLCIFEDTHWSDPTTLEVLDLLIQRVVASRVLMVITYRPEFAPPWGGYAHVTTHTLNRMTRRQVATLVGGVTGGQALPDEVLDLIAAKTDGVPLFVEELTKTVLEGGFLRAAGDHYVLTGPLPPLAIPATLQDALMARLDRFAPVKVVAQLGAVLGREFSYDLIAAVSPLPDTRLQEALEQLVRAGLLFRRGAPPAAMYLFKHALVQDTAYQSLLRSTRQQYHHRIAQVLETQLPETAENQPELLAYHYTEAGLQAQALPYWQRAGQRANARSAYREAVACFERALKVLRQLPESRDTRELVFDLCIHLRHALFPLREFARLLAVLREAETLAETLDDSSRLSVVANYMGHYFWIAGEPTRAVVFGQRAVDQASRGENSALQIANLTILGLFHHSLGKGCDNQWSEKLR